MFTIPPNPALNLAPFGRWTLRDEAAQRRLALRLRPTGATFALRARCPCGGVAQLRSVRHQLRHNRRAMRKSISMILKIALHETTSI